MTLRALLMHGGHTILLWLFFFFTSMAWKILYKTKQFADLYSEN